MTKKSRTDSPAGIELVFIHGGKFRGACSYFSPLFLL